MMNISRGAAEINDGYVPGRLTVQARTEREKMADYDGGFQRPGRGRSAGQRSVVLIK